MKKENSISFTISNAIVGKDCKIYWDIWASVNRKEVVGKVTEVYDDKHNLDYDICIIQKKRLSKVEIEELEKRIRFSMPS